MLSACRNEPNVHKEALEANPDGWRGSELSVTIQGNWSNYRWLWHAINMNNSSPLLWCLAYHDIRCAVPLSSRNTPCIKAAGAARGSLLQQVPASVMWRALQGSTSLILPA